MKRSVSLCLAALLLAMTLAACGQTAAPADSGGKLKIVATVFPVWDWTRNLLGERVEDVELTLLLDQGVDMHSFQPTAADLLRIGSCDLLIYVGGASDQWITDALGEAVNSNMTVVNLMETLGDQAKLEETVEGMQAEEEEPEFDEHVWLSLRLAEQCCAAICDGLRAMDPEHGENYGAGLAAYRERLEALDSAYAAAAAEAKRDTLVFADRFPFRYLLDDYRLRYFAAFPGCEAETEASFETVVFLAEKARELSLPAILTTESPVPRLADTVADSAGEPRPTVLVMDSLQSVRREDLEKGVDYLSVMEQNLNVLREALN